MNIEQNVLFNEIEVTNTPVSITEEQEKLNNEFIETVFNACKSYVDSCCCSARDAFIKRFSVNQHIYKIFTGLFV